MEPLQPRCRRHVRAAVVLGLLSILAAPCWAQLPTIPGMPSMPQPDPVEAQKRLFAQLERCRSTAGQPSTPVSERTFCKYLDGLLTYSSGRRDDGKAAMMEAAEELGAAGDGLGRTVLLLQIAESAKMVSDHETSISVLDSALKAIAELRRSEESLSVETLRYFSRLGGMPDDYIEHLDSIVSTTRSMILHQFELQARLKLGQIHLVSIDHDAAEPHLIAARQLSNRLLGIFDTQVLDLLGQLRERQGRRSEAAELYGQAAAAARLQGDDASARRLDGRRRDLETAGEAGAPPSSVENGSVPRPADDVAAPRRAEPGVRPLADLLENVDALGTRYDARMFCDDGDSAECRFARGLDAVDAGRIRDGLDEMRASLTLWEGGEDRLSVLLARWSLAQAWTQVGEWQRASAVAATGLAEIDVLRHSTEPLYPSRWLERLADGLELPGLGDPEEPLHWITRRIVLAMVEVYLRDVTATARLRANRLDDAEAESRRAVELSESFGGMIDGEVFATAGRVAVAQGRLDEAARYFSRALDATQRFGMVSASLDLLVASAEVEDRRGDGVAADRLRDRAFVLATMRPDLHKGSSVVSGALAAAVENQDVEAIERWTERGADVATASGDPLIRLQVQLGRVLKAILAGDVDDATAAADGVSELADDVVRARPDLGHVRGLVAVVLGGLGVLGGRPERLAIEIASREEAIGEDADELSAAWLAAGSELAKHLALEPNTMPSAFGDLATALRHSGSSSMARQAGTIEAMASIVELDSESLAVIGQLSDDPSVTAGLHRWLTMPKAILEGARGDPEAAGALRSATDWFDTSGFDDLGAVNRMALATLHLVNGRLNEAAHEALAAVEAFDVIATEMATDELLRSFVGRSEGFLRMAVWLIATEIGPEEALAAAETVRAPTLALNLGQAAVDRRSIDDPELARQLAAQRQRVVELAEDRTSSNDDLAVARSQHREIVTRIQLAEGVEVRAREIVPVDLASIRRDVLPAETDLIVFFLTPRSLLAWVLNRDGLEQLQLPRPKRVEIDCLARWWRRSARGAEWVASWTCDGEPVEQLNQRLYERWIEPLESVARHERWIVVPHDLLHYVPLAALHDPATGKRLIDRRTIAYAPSVRALRYLTGRVVEHDGRALVLGNPTTSLPPLPGAEREALDVAELFGTSPKLGAAARESVLYEASRVDVIHLAAHGVYRPRAPRFSYLALAEGEGSDGLLEIDEVAGALDLDGVDLVTLSACQTALGEHRRGDEILSLPRAFLQAGAPAVVSTLWRVDDESTAFLMRAFYQQLRAGATYGEALRQAQLDTARQPRWSDPYYWAAFVLTGDPGIRWAVSE
ncbi:MAG: CHAT domain-containing tetratricopeptide repeat protein [Acidobacteriota bacterium]